MTKRIQYYMDDLARILDIGAIEEIRVETLDNGKQVLRISCAEKKEPEYTTITAKNKPKSSSKGSPRKVSDQPKALVNKAADVIRAWKNKEMIPPEKW